MGGPLRWREGKIGTVYSVGGTHLLGGKRQELTQKPALLAFVSSARSSHSDDAQ